MNDNTKKLVGAVIAAALAAAVYYGFINQQTASNIQGQANQTLGTTPASQQTQSPAPAPAPQTQTPAPQTPNPAPQSPAPSAPNPQKSDQSPRQ